jgi:hypothetical protein
MKAKTSENVLKHSVISALTLAFFFILATGSFTILDLVDIEVDKQLVGIGIYEEIEYHRSNNQYITRIGEQDGHGRWKGWIVIEYYKANNNLIYQEQVYMLNGRRQGLCTRRYPDGSVVEEHYLNGMKIDLKKAAEAKLAEGSAFGLIQDRYPWILFVLEAFGYDAQYVQSYLDTTETILGTYTFTPEEFDNYYEQVQDSLGETPYDSIIASNYSLSMSTGFQRMKDDPLRMAVIDRYRSGEGAVFSILESTYPHYIVEMNSIGVIGADLVQFCNALDDSLDLMGVLDPEDPFFVDSVDSWYFQAVGQIMNAEDNDTKATLLKRGIPDHPVNVDMTDLKNMDLHDLINESKTTLHLHNQAATPSEVAEMVMMSMFVRLLEGDLIRKCVYDAYLQGAGVPNLPTVGTQFTSDNSATSATLNGYVIEDGGANITARGIAWADFYDPTVTDNTEAAGSGTGQFSVTLENLTEGETYYARAYATNSAGTAYGNVISFVAGNTVGTGKGEGEATDLAIYPNPASSKINIRFQSGSPASFDLLIYDTAGRMVLQHKAGNTGAGKHAFILDVSGIPDGFYHCRLLRDGIPFTSAGLLIAR